MKTLNTILRYLCFFGISVVLSASGFGCFTWQWWVIMLLMLFYTLLLAVYDI